MTNGDDFPQDAPGSRTLKVDGGWEFLELSNFGRQYVHIYSLIHALKAAAGTSGDHEKRLRWAFRAFPWRGGWSSVNFFQSLVDAVPNKHRPRIAKSSTRHLV